MKTRSRTHQNPPTLTAEGINRFLKAIPSDSSGYLLKALAGYVRKALGGKLPANVREALRLAKKHPNCARVEIHQAMFGRLPAARFNGSHVRGEPTDFAESAGIGHDYETGLPKGPVRVIGPCRQ